MNKLRHRSKLTVFNYTLEPEGVRVVIQRTGAAAETLHPYEKLPWYTNYASGGNRFWLFGMMLFLFFAVIGGLGAAAEGGQPVTTGLVWICVSFGFWVTWILSRDTMAALPYAEDSLVIISAISKEEQLQAFLDELQRQKFACLERKLQIVREEVGLADVVRYLHWWKDSGVISLSTLDSLWNQLKPAVANSPLQSQTDSDNGDVNT